MSYRAAGEPGYEPGVHYVVQFGLATLFGAWVWIGSARGKRKQAHNSHFLHSYTPLHKKDSCDPWKGITRDNSAHSFPYLLLPYLR